MKYTKVRDVKDPTGNRVEDAGIDLYIPNDWNQGNSYMLGIGSQVNIPSGLKFEVPAGYMLKIDNKSGVATKKGLLVGATIVDHGYRGEVHINLFKVVGGLNDTEYQTTELQPGEKIAQAILIPISTEEIEQISNEEYDNLPTTSRGAGGFGSTGVK